MQRQKLFNMCEVGVVNADDPVSEYIMNHTECKQFITLSTKKSSATLYASNIVNHLTGVNFDVCYNQVTYPVEMQTPGEFSVYNGLTAMGALLALQIPIESIIKAFKFNSQIKGRFQSLASPTGFTAIIDYAHAPDGLLNVLNAMKGFATHKIITVFGCGGDRDRSKRPIMGEIAGKLSDYCVITSDNPRTEEPEAIIDEIEIGMKKTPCNYECITDRRAGIHKALSIAKQGDLVLIAGKGHEDYQIIGKVKHHFDDEEVVKEFFKEIG
jgi:UDP-N-acetylmuramoyl-L-alanyl-D-glutamate--2,6-diaminopimelate ligase